MKITLPKREIKFRAWDKENKKMIGPNFPVDDIYLSLGGKLYNGLNGVEFSHNFILMQYTGFKDKNRKEIYEGDIIKLYDKFSQKWEVGTIVFKDGCFVWKKAHDDLIQWLTPYPREWEIIGNIFENPELLVK